MPSQTEAKKREFQARLASNAPRIPWDKFYRQIEWRAGEHFAMIGPTGQGKTTMFHNVLPLHPYVAVMATKPADESMDILLRSGYRRFPAWQSIPAREVPRRVIWPDSRRLDSVAIQKEVFSDTLGKIFLEGGWTVALDELWWFCNKLKLSEEVKTYLLQGRSLGLSLLAATQRPSAVPVEIYDQSTHLMFWRDNDRANLDRIAGISYLSSDMIRRIVASLEQFQVLYINSRTGMMCRTRAPKPKGR